MVDEPCDKTLVRFLRKVEALEGDMAVRSNPLPLLAAAEEKLAVPPLSGDCGGLGRAVLEYLARNSCSFRAFRKG